MLGISSSALLARAVGCLPEAATRYTSKKPGMSCGSKLSFTPSRISPEANNLKGLAARAFLRISASRDPQLKENGGLPAFGIQGLQNSAATRSALRRGQFHLPV